MGCSGRTGDVLVHQCATQIVAARLQKLTNAVETDLDPSGLDVVDVAAIGDPSDRMYVIVSGKVGISIAPDPAAKQFVSTLGPGDCFGEMGLFDDLPRSATAHVLADAQLLALDKFKLRGLIVSYPELLLGLLRGLSHRLRGANEMIARGRN